MIGSTISHYRIIEKLGEGGMGIVYKAHDIKLDRFVALKFLPHQLSANEAERARFLQEARAASALNHPNICGIHSIGEDEDKQFIEMEYVDGKTLRQMIPIGKTQTAIDYAIQIGEALHEAHSKGIVHRDVKAENIMVNSKNQIKVMDFGLAKLKGSLKLTKTSSTVGTLAYMAPEQIQGGEVDARSDIFSFGVLLFEMLTGRTPFRGEHEAAMVYSIVNEQPEPIQTYRPEISSEVVHILEKALEKDPADRFQSTADMVVDLRRALKQSSRLSSATVSGAHRVSSPQAEPRTPSPQPSRRNLRLGVGGLALLIIIAAVYFLLRTNGSTSIPRLNPGMTTRVLPIRFTQFSYPGISKDGSWIAFPAPDANNKWDFYYMHISSGDLRRITWDSMSRGVDLIADISPDGGKIAYRYNAIRGSQSRVVSVNEGVRTILLDSSYSARWRPDGQRIGCIRTEKSSTKAFHSFWSVKFDGTDSRREFADTLGYVNRVSFAWSPDGQSIAWIRSFKEGYQEVITRDLSTEKERQLTSDKGNIDDVWWTRNDAIVFSSIRSGNTNLWMVPVAGGPPRQITNGSGPDIGISMSADGQKLVYLQQQRVGNIWIANIDGSSARQVTFDEREISSASLSPDGKQIAFAMSDVDPLKPSLHLFVQDRNGAKRSQITTGNPIARNPRWSPDGNWIAFSMSPVTDPRGDSANVYIVDAANRGAPKSIIPGVSAKWLNSNSLVATRLNYVSNEMVTLQGGPPKKFFEDSTNASPVASGRRILYVDRHEGRGGEWWIISADYATNAAKSRAKRLFAQGEIRRADITTNFLYYWNQRGELWRLNLSTESKERLKGPFPGLEAGAQIFVRDDDKEFLYVPFKLSGKLVLIENLFQ